MQIDVRLSADLKVLRLQPGDALVVEVNGRLSMEQAKALQAYVEKQFDGHRCLVLDSDAKLSVGSTMHS